MDLVEIYDTLQKDVGKRTEGLNPASSGLGTRWSPEYPMTDRSRDIRQVDRDAVKINNPDLAAELDSFEELHDAFGAVGDAVSETLQEDYIGNHLDEARYDRRDRGERYLTGSAELSSYADGSVELGRWALLNMNPIVEADDPEEFRYRLRDNTGVARTDDLDALYDRMDAQDANGEVGDDAWYEELWSLVNDPHRVPADEEGGLYSIREALQERRSINEDIAETASRLEPELQRSRQEALAQYRAGLTTRIARRIRR